MPQLIENKVQEEEFTIADYIQSMDDFKDLEETWIIKDILPAESLFLIYAQPGHQKSLFTLNMAKAIVKGDNFLGQTTIAQNVLIVDGEMSRPNIARRRNAMKLSGISSDRLGYIAVSRITKCEYNLSVDKYRHDLIKVLQNSDYKVVILDNIRTLFNVANENAAAEYMPLNSLIKIIRGMGITCIVLHHANKATLENPDPSFAGSSNIATLYDACMSLVADAQSVLTIRVKKDRDSLVREFLHELPVVFSDGDYQILNVEAENQKERINLAARIMRVIETDVDAAKSTKTLYARCEITKPKELSWKYLFDNFLDETHLTFSDYDDFMKKRAKLIQDLSKKLMEQEDDFQFPTI
ncbi:AAA family ATPase [Photobacterium phosphoreum]|nr:AAA family ATPase [Photobacterium phosphoreum]MCD9493261.1 AAA family ATPase [Photobacterium phosphoreum]MCF2192527.1 AAA family ATPase [Photobacterium phosphoreum]